MRPCSLRLPGCTNAPEETVLCHAPCIDDGRGFKSPDHWAAFGCRSCHDIVDGRTPAHQAMVEPVDIAEAWLRGIYETQRYFIRIGIIKLGQA